MKKFDFSIESIGVKLFISFAIASIFNVLLSEISFTEMHFFEEISLFRTLAIVGFSFILLLLLSKNKKYRKKEPFLLIGISLLFLLIVNIKNQNFHFLITSTTIMAFIIFKYYPKLNINFSNKKTKWLYIIFALCYVAFISYTLVLNHLRYLTPNFDFGIFSQVYYYMKETGVSYATSVRQYITTQLHIHFSPILYLLLPIYYIFPNPITLIVMQGVLLAIGLYPLYKLCKIYKLNNFFTTLIGLLYVLHPSIIGGNMYYFHEYNFLAPLILFLLYYIEKKDYKMVIVFAFLTAFVKEDAPIFVAVIGLYFMFFKEKRKLGTYLFFGAVAYFITIILFLSKYGDGVMNYRYMDFIYEHESLFKMIINIFKNPGYLLKIISDHDRFKFLIYLLLPLGFIPVLFKNKRDFILFTPLILICLMTSHIYQYDVKFYYGFGPSAILFYLLISNFNKIKPEIRNKLLMLGLSSSILIFGSLYHMEFYNYKYYKFEKENIEILNNAVKMIPKDKSVSASTFLVAQLSQRDFVYEYGFNQTLGDYIAIDLRFEEDIEEKENYEVFYEAPKVIKIYRKIDLDDNN